MNMVKLINGDSDFGSDILLERKIADCNNFNKIFYGEADNCTRQFASLYMARTEELSLILQRKASEKWGSDIKILPLASLEDHEGKCIIIGSLYKHQQNKPSILQELSDDHQMTLPDPKEHYCSYKDQLFLEDQTSRIKLTGEKVDIRKSVTGVICAILGVESAKSTFEVEDWCYAGCPSPNSSLIRSTIPGKIVFVSGLELAMNSAKLPLTMLLEWLQGYAGRQRTQQESASIVRVVIAGNNIKGAKDSHLSKGLMSGKAEDAASAKEMTDGIQKLDEFLAILGTNCYVTLMPGQFDITTLMMPQRPMSPGCFPKAKCLNTIKGVSNPWVGQINDTIVIGTSGQPIHDMQKVCGNGTFTPLECLEKTLEWRHMCPTAPDTVPCLPFSESDPFIIRECPHIFFAGDMEEFDTKIYEGPQGQKVRLLCVPKFSKTRTAVVVDLNTLEATPVLFGPFY